MGTSEFHFMCTFCEKWCSIEDEIKLHIFNSHIENSSCMYKRLEKIISKDEVNSEIIPYDEQKFEIAVEENGIQVEYVDVAELSKGTETEKIPPKLEEFEDNLIELSDVDFSELTHRSSIGVKSDFQDISNEKQTSEKFEENQIEEDQPNFDANEGNQIGVHYEDDSAFITLSRSAGTSSDSVKNHDQKSKKVEEKADQPNSDRVEENGIEVDYEDVETPSESVLLQKKYSCSHCLSKFSDSERLHRHEILFCDKNLVSLKNRVVVENGVYPCPDCPKTFSTWETLHLHAYNQHLAENVKCFQCGNVYKNLHSLQSHLRKGRCKMDPALPSKFSHGSVDNSDQKEKYVCNFCHKSFGTQHFLEKHRQLYHRHSIRKAESNKEDFESIPKKFVSLNSCNHCPVKFSSLEKSRKHEILFCHQNPASLKNTVIVENGVYLCSDCPKTFSSWSSIYQHAYRGHLAESVKCFQCGNVYKHLTSLKTHLERGNCEMDPAFLKEATSESVQDSDEKGKYVCKFCHMSFNIKEVLEKHHQTYHHIFQNKSESNRDNSESIANSNATEENLLEDLCDQPDSDPAEENQIEVDCEEDSTLLTLPETDRTYSDSGQISGQEESFICHLCNKSFRTENSLGIHQQSVHNIFKRKVESNEENFKNIPRESYYKYTCSHCSTKNSTSERSFRHEVLFCAQNPVSLKNRVVVENGLYLCTDCPKSFSTWDTLHGHAFRCHMSENVKCFYCDSIFKNLEALRKHLQSGICEMDSTLSDNVENSNPIGKFYCHLCNKSYRTKTFLEKHHESYHNIYKRKADSNRDVFESIPKKIILEYSCKHCSKKFSTAERNHRHEHLYCDQNPESLKKRVVVQNGVYLCNYCPKTYSNCKALENHTYRQHLAENKECPQCGNFYKNYESLRGHLRKEKCEMDPEKISK